MVQTIAILALYGWSLFRGAGTLTWPAGWLLTAFYVVYYFASFWVLDPRVIALRSGRETGMKRWDPPLATLGFILLFPLLFYVAGHDAVRHHWSPELPWPLRVVAAAIFVAGNFFATWAASTNLFFSKFVKIQTERDHFVVTTGPYAFVRHPGYAGALVAHLALPIALGSLWALLPAVAGTATLALRTALEDRTLREELPGYRDYAARVPCRLVPFLW